MVLHLAGDLGREGGTFRRQGALLQGAPGGLDHVLQLGTIQTKRRGKSDYLDRRVDGLVLQGFLLVPSQDRSDEILKIRHKGQKVIVEITTGTPATSLRSSRLTSLWSWVL